MATSLVPADVSVSAHLDVRQGMTALVEDDAGRRRHRAHRNDDLAFIAAELDQAAQRSIGAPGVHGRLLEPALGVEAALGVGEGGSPGRRHGKALYFRAANAPRRVARDDNSPGDLRGLGNPQVVEQFFFVVDCDPFQADLPVLNPATRVLRVGCDHVLGRPAGRRLTPNLEAISPGSDPDLVVALGVRSRGSVDQNVGVKRNGPRRAGLPIRADPERPVDPGAACQSQVDPLDRPSLGHLDFDTGRRRPFAVGHRHEVGFVRGTVIS